MHKLCIGICTVCLLLPSILFAQDIDIIQMVRDQKQTEVIQLLKDQPDLLQTRTENLNSSLIHVAAQTGCNEVLQYLFTTDLAIDNKNWDWHTALHWAAYVENLEGISLLITNGAKLEAATYTGETPLRVAVDYSRLEAVKALIEAGANPNTQAKNGISLLHGVAIGGSAEIASYLIEKGLDPNSRNLYKKTPLHYAAIMGQDEVITVLLDNGADLTAVDINGYNALNFAIKADKEAVVAQLKAAGLTAAGAKFPELEGPYMGQKPPGQQPELFAPGIVSTEGWEFAPTITADGKEMLFTRRKGEDDLPRNTIMTTNTYEGSWTRPEVTLFSGEYFDYEPFVINNGKRLIFGSRRPVAEGAEAGPVNQWVLDRKDNSWTNMRLFGPPVQGREVMFPTMAANGNLYYSGPNENDDYDLFVCNYSDGQYSDPVALGGGLDSLKPKMHPFIAPDESYVLFDAQPNAPENYDNYTYVCFRDNDGSWSTAREIKFEHPLISTHGIASVSPDGKYLFFSSGGNIFWVDAKILDQYRN